MLSSELTAPRYLPHITHPEVLTVGMRPMTGAWLESSPHPEAMRAHKQERRNTMGAAVYAVTPSGLSGARELAAKIAATLGLHPAPWADLPAEEWLWHASLETHEDLVVMVPEGDSYALMAASLCSPSHWRLPEKIGRPMARVHDPIPGIHDRLTPRIDRIFHHLRVDTPVERYNWALQAGNDLFAWPSDHTETLAPDTPLWYRVERQTLTRLPESGALAFTIGVHLNPLESLLVVPGALSQLLAAIDSTPTALQHYKSFDWLVPALDKYRTLANDEDRIG